MKRIMKSFHEVLSQSGKAIGEAARVELEKINLSSNYKESKKGGKLTQNVANLLALYGIYEMDRKNDFDVAIKRLETKLQLIDAMEIGAKEKDLMKESILAVIEKRSLNYQEKNPVTSAMSMVEKVKLNFTESVRRK